MTEPSADEARRLLRAACSAEEQGSATVRRPWWYALGLGLSTGLALAAFAVPPLTTAGIVLFAVIAPVALETEARRRTGGSPERAYLKVPIRRTAVAYATGGALVAATSLAALKVSGESWTVLPGAAVLTVWTVVAACRVERLRSRAHERFGSGA